MYQDCLTDCEEIRVSVYLRSSTPALGVHSRRVAFLETLANAAGNGLVDTYDVTLIGDEICVCDHCRNLPSLRSTIDIVEKLMSWRDGGIRACGFTQCKSSSTLPRETHNTITPPDLTTGIYADEQLIGVFPARADGQTYTPRAFLSRVMREQNGEHDTPLELPDSTAQESKSPMREVQQF
jgi:hypothetical protein